MLPFVDFSYFFILLIISLPAIFLGLNSKPISIYTPFATLLALLYTFSFFPAGLLCLVSFVGLQFILVKLYQADKKLKKFFFVFILLILSPLILTKIIPGKIEGYLGFLVGISYLTFKALQVFLETHDGLIKLIDWKAYFNFMLFFPTFSSGPIDRSRRFDKNFALTIPKTEYKKYLYKGIHKIFTGFLYKFIIAFLIKFYWLDAIGNEKNLLNSLSYMYSYSLYLFFDFAGYSAFAIGFSYIFGIVTPDNFNAPFLARNIRDFWNRWHISLSSWFRDFVFMRFLVWVARNKYIKSPRVAACCGYMFSFGLMGLWHGPSAHYILYGLYHGLLFTVYELISSHPLKRKFLPSNKNGIIISNFITLHVVAFGLLIFSGWLFR